MINYIWSLVADEYEPVNADEKEFLEYIDNQEIEKGPPNLSEREETITGEYDDSVPYAKHLKIKTKDQMENAQRMYLGCCFSFFSCALLFFTLFLLIPRAPLILLESTTATKGEPTYAVSQTFKVHNRNVFSVRFRNFESSIDTFSTLTDRPLIGKGFWREDNDFLLHTDEITLITMRYEFNITEAEKTALYDQCMTETGIRYLSIGSIQMYAYGMVFDIPRIGAYSAQYHCKS